MNKEDEEFVWSDFNTLGCNIFLMYELYPAHRPEVNERYKMYADNDSTIQVSYMIDRKLDRPELGGKDSLRQIYRILQRFLRVFDFNSKPDGMSWKDFVLDNNCHVKSNKEAYDWVHMISKIYAKVLYEKDVITEDERDRLFQGELIAKIPYKHNFGTFPPKKVTDN